MAHNIVATTAEGIKFASLFYESKSAYSKAIYKLLDCTDCNKGDSGDGSYKSVPKEVFEKALHTLKKEQFDVFDYVTDSSETRKNLKDLKLFLSTCLKSAKRGNLIIVTFK